MFRECGGRLVRGEKLKKHLTVNRRDINNFKELITSKFQFCGRKEKSYGLALWHVHKFGTRKLTGKLTRKAYSKIQHPFGTSAKRNPNRCLYVFWGGWNSSCGCVTVHLSSIKYVGVLYVRCLLSSRVSPCSQVGKGGRLLLSVFLEFWHEVAIVFLSCVVVGDQRM